MIPDLLNKNKFKIRHRRARRIPQFFGKLLYFDGKAKSFNNPDAIALLMLVIIS